MKKKVCGSNILAFTLAEVLVTLSVIGVVASVTVSSIIHNYKKAETISRLKVAYKMLNEITRQARTENRGLNYPNSFSMNATTDFNKYVRPYVRISKNCGTGYQQGNNRCFASPKGGWYDIYGYAHQHVNDEGQVDLQTNSGYDSNYYYKVVLHNGMSLAFFAAPTGYYSTKVSFIVDLDGPYKGYSKLGQDTFMFNLNFRTNPPELIPGSSYGGSWADMNPIWYNDTHIRGLCVSTDDYSYTYISSSRGVYRGSGCSAYIIKNNWKFPTDYPWALANKKPKDFEPVRK